MSNSLFDGLNSSIIYILFVSESQYIHFFSITGAVEVAQPDARRCRISVRYLESFIIHLHSTSWMQKIMAYG